MRGSPRVLVLVLCVLAIVLVAGTYGRLSFTYDEPVHIAAGLQFLDGRYEYREHPPLSRIAVGLGPWLAGVRSPPPDSTRSAWEEGRILLFDSSVPTARVLTLARLGTLLFLILGVVVVWRAATALWSPWSPWAGVLAAALLALQPVFLGHAGLATTDAAAAATLVLAAWLGVRFLEEPTTRNTLLAGLGVGLALGTKFSAVLFLPVIAIALLVAGLARGGFLAGLRRTPVRRILGRAAAFTAAAAVLLWMVYGFRVGPALPPENAPFEGLDALVGQSGFLHDVAYALVTMPLPMPDLPRGILLTFQHAGTGHRGYFLGQVGESGWPLFFPLALLFKTPIPFLILVAAGYVAGLTGERSKDWRVLGILLVPPALLLSVMLSSVTIGLRHLLGIYPFLAIVAAGGGVALARRGRLAAAFVAVLVAWQAVGVARAMPDLFAYFSEPFESAPERYLIDSDLAWQQDLLRTREYLDHAGVDSVRVAIMGLTPRRRLEEYGFPEVEWLQPYEPAPGWIVVDWYTLRVGSNSDIALPPDAFAWLLAYEPVARIGAATRIYHFDTAPSLPPDLARSRDAWRAGGGSFLTADDFAGDSR